MPSGGSIPVGNGVLSQSQLGSTKIFILYPGNNIIESKEVPGTKFQLSNILFLLDIISFTSISFFSWSKLFFFPHDLFGSEERK